MSKKGLIHVYYGDGKGKTTAALGLALRAAGCGQNVVIVQFLKNWKCGEHEPLSKLTNITLLQGKVPDSKFVHEMTEEEKHQTKTIQNDCLKKAVELTENNKCNLLVLDEALDAQELGVLDTRILEELIYSKPDLLELIITGRRITGRLFEHADYVTEMVKHKHPYDKGVGARRGIEY